MPNKIKVTKEDILNCALTITKKTGIGNVNARIIAKELNCSIQPIYYYFETMDNLRKQIVHEARKIYNSYIEDSKKIPTIRPLKRWGLPKSSLPVLNPICFSCCLCPRPITNSESVRRLTKITIIFYRLSMRRKRMPKGYTKQSGSLPTVWPR